MCGILGIITNQGNISLGKVVLKGIKRLEYRGYDSCGIVSLSNSKLYIKKDSGKIEEIQKKKKLKKIQSLRSSTRSGLLLRLPDHSSMSFPSAMR